MESLGTGIKKFILAGIGTAAVTTEKSKEILDELVKKGELTVEQGKVLNQELKHNMKEAVKDKMNITIENCTSEELYKEIEKLTPEQLSKLKEQIQKIEAKQKSKDNSEQANDMEYLEDE